MVNLAMPQPSAPPLRVVTGLTPQAAEAQLEQFGGYQELGSDWPYADTSKGHRQVK